MKEVILTVGPQGAGKSTFCNNLASSHPKLSLISRDAILIELFGTVWLSPYTGGHFTAIDLMWQRMEELLQKEFPVIILDCWNGEPEERMDITEHLRHLGAEKIGAWRFVTSPEKCLEWYEKRTREEKLREKKGQPLTKYDESMIALSLRSCELNYRIFQEMPVELSQGFDYIRQVNPLDPPSFESLISVR